MNNILNMISRLGEDLLVPPLQSILGPFIRVIGVEHPHNVMIKDPILKSAIVHRPAFTTQRNTGLKTESHCLNRKERCKTHDDTGICYGARGNFCQVM